MPLPKGREKKAKFYRCTVDGCAVKGEPAYKDGSFRNGFAVCGFAAFGGQGRDKAAAERKPAPADQAGNKRTFWCGRKRQGAARQTTTRQARCLHGPTGHIAPTDAIKAGCKPCLYC